MGFPSFVKDPDARLDYEVDWSDWLPTGDTIVASSWQVDDPALTLSDEDFSTTSAVVFAAGGELGKSYLITNRITTAPGGRINDQTIKIKIKSQ